MNDGFQVLAAQLKEADKQLGELRTDNTALTSKLDEAVGLLKHANIRIHNLGFAFNKNKDGGEILESYADEKINTFLASLDKPESEGK